MFQTEPHFFRFRVTHQTLPKVDAVSGALFGRNSRLDHSGESEDVFRADSGSEINPFPENFAAVLMVRYRNRTLSEAVAAYKGNFESEFHDFGVETGSDAFHGFQSDGSTMLSQLHHGHRIKTPAHNRLANFSVADDCVV